ncbi:response regulator [Lyngbya aestuarii]|uniref:response regulator n=1 Tax=Lyngbya aestuarii TaxID=118322 RepID=UPI00403DD5EC
MTKVLVIENEEIFREILINILKREGFDAIGAENGSQGLNLAREFAPDLILCDVKMPELNGYDVLRALRQNDHTANIPFIFLTAETIHSVIDQGQLLGANGYLTKPFTTAQLLEAINKRVR